LAPEVLENVQEPIQLSTLSAIWLVRPPKIDPFGLVPKVSRFGNQISVLSSLPQLFQTAAYGSGLKELKWFGEL